VHNIHSVNNNTKKPICEQNLTKLQHRIAIRIKMIFSGQKIQNMEWKMNKNSFKNWYVDYLWNFIHTHTDCHSKWHKSNVYT